MSKINRRIFIASTLIGVGTLSGISISVQPLRFKILTDSFLEHYSYLKIDRQDVEQFILDFESERFSLWRDPLKYRDNLPLIVYNTFLLSTDFFRNGANSSLRVTYTGLFAPPFICNNPFTKGHLLGDEEQLPRIQFSD